MEKLKVVIPYTPRFPQTDIHAALESHRFAVLVAHRFFCRYAILHVGTP